MDLEIWSRSVLTLNGYNKGQITLPRTCDRSRHKVHIATGLSA